ncbi:MAG: SRPBCC family protein [Bacteroidales bacterium]
MAKEIKIERVYSYPVEKVWKAVSTSEALAEWLMPNDFKLEKGYEFTFKTKPQPGFDGIVNCKVIDFEVPKKLQFTWQGGPIKTPTLVSFELEPIPEGTRLHFKHSGFVGFINQYIIRFILGSGWKGLLRDKIQKYLDQ